MNFIHQIEPYITEREIEAVNEYLKSGGWLTEFKKTEEFESMIAQFLDTKYVVVVTSGTVALYLALLALDMKETDKVLVPNYTMIATVNAVRWAGAEPVIVDVEKQTLCMDLEKIKLDSGCKAMIYVSINGRSSDMEKIVRFCRDNKLILIEDTCQAFGSKWKNKHLGSFGEAGVLSFTPHKIITTGQGGAVVTNSNKIYKKVKGFKDFCRLSPGTDWHEGIGFNFKFTDLQAVVGIEQMKTIDFRIERKKKIFKIYQERLSKLKGVQFLDTDLKQTVPWFMDILLPTRGARDSLSSYLKTHNIGSREFYPPVNHQKSYSYYPKGSFPVSEKIDYRGLWLPSSLNLDEESINYICDEIKCFLETKGWPK